MKFLTKKNSKIQKSLGQDPISQIYKKESLIQALQG